MSVSVRIEPRREDLERIRSAFDRLARLGRDARRPLARIAIERQRDARRRLRARPHDWGAPTTRLNRSITFRVGPMEMEVGSNLVYAAIQQVGGTIRPRTVRYLAIPVLPHLRRGGVWPRDIPRGELKFVPRAEIRIGLRSWTGPALVRERDEVLTTTTDSRGRRLRDEGGRFARKGGKRGEVMFALVRKATIRARPYLVWDDAAREFAARQFEAEVARTTRGG